MVHVVVVSELVLGAHHTSLQVQMGYLSVLQVLAAYLGHYGVGGMLEVVSAVEVA